MRGSAVLLCLTIASLVLAQESGSFFEEFDVVLNQLQVNIIDQDGLPIRDLQKEDIELLLDGKLQEIESLQEINLERDLMTADRENRNIPEQARRLFVFLFDLRYSTKKGVLESQAAAREFIMSSMLPSDLVGVFTYTQLAGITLVNNFTSDINHLMNAIDTLGLNAAGNTVGGPSGYILDEMLTQYAAIQGIGAGGELASNAPSTGSNAQAEARTFGSQHLDEMFRLARNSEKRNYEREVLGFLGSMEKLGDGLRFIRGRKNLIWFSTGFDATSLVGASSEKLKEYSEYSMNGLLERVPADQYGRGDVQSQGRRVVESLQAAGVVVFAVDTSRNDELSSEKHGLQSLNFFSVDTGGRVFSNRNEYLEVLNEIQAITNHYYLLSFYPNDVARKKEVSKVRLRVSGNKKAQIYASKGMLTRLDFGAMTKIERDIHIAEYIARDQVVRGLPLNVSALPLPASNNLTRISITSEIGGEYFEDQNNRTRQRDFEVFSMAIEDESSRTFDQNYYKFTITPEIAGPRLVSAGIKYFSDVYVKPGTYRIKVVVRDLVNGKISSWIEKIEVPDRISQVCGPVLISDLPWVTVRKTAAQERKSRADELDFSYPYHIGKRNLSPNVDSVVASGQPIRLLYLLDYRESVGNRKTPAIQLLFMDKNKRYIMIPPEAVTVDMELLDEPPYLTNLLVSLDQTRLNLIEGETYKLLAYFTIEGQPALKTMSELSISNL